MTGDVLSKRVCTADDEWEVLSLSINNVDATY
jgi:hypothetical protein